MKESDLFPPLEAYLVAQGYRVQGEVCGCDLVALRGEDLLVVEMKVAFNVKLLYQAVRRLAITPAVYVAFPRPAARQKMSFWQMVKSLARRLEIGVLLVEGGRVNELVAPAAFTGRASARKKDQVLKEFHGRRASKNVGGVTREKINTAYLENAVNIGVLLERAGKLNAKTLREMGTNEKTYAVLYHNHYGWFERESQGYYRLKRGKAGEIRKAHPEIWSFYEREARKKTTAARATTKPAPAKKKPVTGKQAAARKKAPAKKKAGGKKKAAAKKSAAAQTRTKKSPAR